MRFEKRTKGGRLWRLTSEKDAIEMVGFQRLGDLAAGATLETPYAFVRRRAELEPQPNLPGVGEGPGAYGRE